MSHDHPGHTHQNSRSADRRALAIVLGLVVVYMVAELTGGILTNSLALIADAGHMLSDAAALALSLFAIWVAQRPSDPKRTYGYYRAEILAALANGATLIALSVYIFFEAYHRFVAPPQVMGGAMMGVACGGLAINVASLWLLHSGKSNSLNVRAAWLHVVGDALGSVGAIVAGLLIFSVEWYWADPLASVLIAGLVLYSSWSLVKESVAVLMEGTPKDVNVDHVRDAVMSIDGVSEVHDLHVWSITSGLKSLSAHVVVGDSADQAAMLSQVRQLLHDRFGIQHVTIQIEPAGFKERSSAICDVPTHDSHTGSMKT